MNKPRYFSPFCDACKAPLIPNKQFNRNADETDFVCSVKTCRETHEGIYIDISAGEMVDLGFSVEELIKAGWYFV